MSISITQVKINNTNIQDASIEVPLDVITINWDIQTTTPSIKQLSYEIRIGTHNVNWGTSNYIPDVLSQPYARDRSQYWRFKPKFLQRGQKYYGQIRVKDTTNEESEWVRFAFLVNRLPFLTYASITPEEPSEQTDLELDLGLSSESVTVKTKWIRNGVHYDQFDNYQKISKEYLRYGDSWYCEITPVDNLEKGPTITAKAVRIVKLPPVTESLKILPINPNVNDILEANYIVNDPNTQTLLVQDKSQIRWYINNELISEANDEKFVRLGLKPNDEVFFTVTPSDGIFTGTTVSSRTVIIQDAGFRTINLRVDGLVRNLNVNSVNPTLEWDVISPYNKSSRYAKIKIGTAPGSDNVYTNVIETYDNKFTIPDNIVRRGIDYYVSVSASDQNDLFTNYETSSFRVAGNLWEREVSNSKGWTFEASLSVSGEGYQRISFADGSRFAEIRFYETKCQLMLGKSNVKIFDIDMTVPRNLIVTAKANDIKVYIQNSLIIDGTGEFKESASDRFIEIGSNGGSEAIGLFKRFVYNIDGAFDPGSSVYSDIRLERFVDFTGMSLADITEHEGNVLVAANPINPTESGVVYKIIETEQPSLAATENVDVFDTKINSIATSPDEGILYIGHGYGASFFDGYFIPKYDSDSVFIAGFDPAINLWELVKTTTFDAASYIEEGLVIDTTISSKQADLSSSTVEVFSTVNTEAISFISLYDSIFSYEFEIEITNNVLTIYLLGTDTVVFTTDLVNKSVSQVVDEIKEASLSTNYFFSLFFDVFANDISVASQSATRLDSIARTAMFPSLTLRGNYQVTDTYNPSPYGTYSTGKWFYCHRKKGTPWFERVDNSRGWTIDFSLRIDDFEDSDTPSNTGKPKGTGIYVNDGLCSENIWFLPQEIIFEGAERSFLYDTTELTDYRLVGKKTRIKLYGKKVSDQSYKLIAETTIKLAATNQGNAARPSIFYDSTGKTHAVWHDDGKGINRRQLYYSYYDANTEWSEPELIVSDDFSSSNPSIAVDSYGNIYVVYETTRSDYTDIAVITKNANGWSEPYLLTSNLYDSFAPKIAIDNKNNVHVVWEDHRASQPQIFYCRRNASNGQWESNAFGKQDIQVTNEAVGAKRPAIISNNTSLYMSWTAFERNGSSSIKMAVYDDGQKKWNSAAQGGFDFSVSGTGSVRADNSTICVDLKGQVFVVWQDTVDNNIQLFGRQINPRLVFAKSVLQLTTGDYDSTHPKAGLNSATGDIFVVFEKQQEKIVSPYDPYVARASDVSLKSPSIAMLKWDASSQVWYSSNQDKPSPYTTSFDVDFDFGLPKEVFRPNIPSKFSGNLHILFENLQVSNPREILHNNEIFGQVRDLIYDFSFVPDYNVSDHETDLFGERRLDGDLNRKELRFGDFSDNLASRFVIGNLRYYLSDAVNPFNISLVSSATTNMPKTEVLAVASNNNGDSWFGTSIGLMYYDRDTSKAYLLDSDNYNIKGLSVNSISFDKKANMFLSTSGGIYASSDHSYFFKLSGNLPAKPVCVDIDGLNNLYIASSEGLYIVSLNNIYSSLVLTKENATTARTIAVADDDIIKIDQNSGLPTNKVTTVKVDASNVAWIGSEEGLIRYSGGEISVFTTANGLNSNKINDIAIRNTAIRYIATTAGVNKMIGVGISPLNFDNTNAPPAAVTQVGVGDVNLPIFVNAKAIRWRNPNILWIASGYNLFQITFTEESFTTERTEITKFRSSDFTLNAVLPKRNDDLQTFRVVGLDDRVISKNTVYEVILNGNKITRGYSFSPSDKLLRFSYPLSETDIIKVNVRFDIEKIGTFAQNKAQQIALGNKATRLERLVSANGSIFASTGGDINTLQINDSVSDLPFDKIILDRTPPRGKITLGKRRERSIFEVNVSPLEDDLEGVFDDVSGIDKMIVSNFTNFTSDGETPLEPIVFTRFLLHNVGEIFDSVSRQFTFESGKGRRLLSYQPIGGNQAMMAGTAEPANVYRYNGVDQTWDLIDTLDVVGGVANPSASVEFLIEYQGRIYAGTGSPNGSGKLWVMNPSTMKFDLLRTLPSNTHAYCAVVFDEVLYFGGGGGGHGSLYSFDGTATTEVFRNISGAIYSLVESDRELYAATGYEGRIYKLDPKNRTQQIVDVNADRNVLSIGKATVNGQGYIFAGMSANGQIKRSKVPDSPFVHSFKTVPSAVHSIRNISDKLYAAIGNTVYSLDNVWNAKYTHNEQVRDVIGGLDNAVWFVSDSYIYKIGRAENVKRVYLKLIDRAGNETNLYTDDAQSVLNENLFDEISISDLASFINRNRVLKIDEFGNAVAIREGNDRFYSADIVEEESGEYFSEIFNGTNNLVAWDKISWDATIPDNTSITVYVKTAATKDELLDKTFEFSIDGKDQSSDISFLTGQFMQFKVVMKSRVRGLSPSLRNVIIKSISSDSTHFFTTNFVLPSRVKSGIVTSTKLLPVSADVVFGINTNNSTDFAEYQIIDENRIFTTDDSQVGSGLRVGVRLITPTKAEASGLVPEEYSPYGLPLLLNAVEWSFKNEDNLERTCNFKVSFYEDPELTNLVYYADSSNSYVGFSSDGDIFPTGGVVLPPNNTTAMSFTPIGNTPLRCNTYYYIKVEMTNEVETLTVYDNYSFTQSCGTTYVDTISFDFTNTTANIETYHFRVRFYNDPERTDLKHTAFSGNDIANWFADESALAVSGKTLNPGQTATINYTPLLSNIDAAKTYYLSIDVFNGEVFENNSNSFTFKANDAASQVYCGSYTDVPVVKNFSIMFELENNEFVSMRVKI